MTIAPWHLWGQSQVVTCPYTGIFSTTTSTSQLAKVSYGRPDTWAFHFFASVQSTVLAVLPCPIEQVLEVHFDLTVGVGRSSVTMHDFEVFKFSCPANGRLDGKQLWSTSVNGPIRDGDYEKLPNVVSRISAESIQCQARTIYYKSNTHGDTAQVNLYCGFTPMTHVRPEWIKGEFNGGEDANGR